MLLKIRFVILCSMTDIPLYRRRYPRSITTPINKIIANQHTIYFCVIIFVSYIQTSTSKAVMRIQLPLIRSGIFTIVDIIPVCFFPTRI